MMQTQHSIKSRTGSSSSKTYESMWCWVGTDIHEAYTRAYEADPVSIFGGIIAANREIDKATAEKLHEIFLEIVIAPSFSQEALEVLQSKKNLRLLTINIEKATSASKN